MQALFLVLAIIVGVVVGFAATYLTLVTKLQKRLESTKSKLGRAKSANEEAETLQAELEMQKGQAQALQAQLEGVGANHQSELDGLQAASTTAIAQLTAEKTALEADKTALQNELQSLREIAQAQLPPDNSDELAALQNRLLEMEQEHQTTVQSLEANYQAQIVALQESLAAVPEPAQEPVAEFVPPVEAIEEEFVAVSEPEDFFPPAAEDASFEEFASPVAEEPVLEEFVPQETEEFAAFETPAIANEAEELGIFREEIENIVAEDFAPLEEADSPFGQAEPEETESDLENWVDASEESPFDMVPAMEAEASVLEEVELEIPEFTAEAPDLADFAPPVEETASLFEESPAPEEDQELGNWVDGPAELSLEETSSEEPSFDLGLEEMPESLDLGEAELELPDFTSGEAFGESPMDLGTELPDMTEESIPSSMEYDFGTPDGDISLQTEQSGDELLAELTGDAATPELELPMFTEETSEEQLGDLDLGAEMPSLELSSEEMFAIPGDAENDDLDFLLELRDEEEPLTFPGEELLPEFTDRESISGGFQPMEMLAEESSDFPDLLETNPETYGGDPFINILDEDPNSSDNDLLALLQNDDGSDGQTGDNKGDDDLFPGLETMLGEGSSDDGFDDLDALLGGADDFPKSASEEVLSLDDFDFGSDDPK